MMTMRRVTRMSDRLCREAASIYTEEQLGEGFLTGKYQEIIPDVRVKNHKFKGKFKWKFTEKGWTIQYYIQH